MARHPRHNGRCYEVVDGAFTQSLASQVSEVNRVMAYLRSLVTRNHYLYEKYNCRRWVIPDLNEYSHVIIHFSALLPFVAGRYRSGARSFSIQTITSENTLNRSPHTKRTQSNG